MGLSKREILNDIFELHWEWDTEPEFGGTDDNPTATDVDSVEYKILQRYDRFKKDALERYDWRSSIRYSTIECSEPVTNNDPRYKYNGDLPDDFIKLTGLWHDAERHMPAINKASAVGTTLHSHLEEITIGYTANVTETELDNWVSTYLIAYIAAYGATLAGVSDEKRAELYTLEQNEWFKCSNIDYEMEAKDQVSPSINQFLIS